MAHQHLPLEEQALFGDVGARNKMDAAPPCVDAIGHPSHQQQAVVSTDCVFLVRIFHVDAVEESYATHTADHAKPVAAAPVGRAPDANLVHLLSDVVATAKNFTNVKTLPRRSPEQLPRAAAKATHNDSWLPIRGTCLGLLHVPLHGLPSCVYDTCPPPFCQVILRTDLRQRYCTIWLRKLKHRGWQCQAFILQPKSAGQ